MTTVVMSQSSSPLVSPGTALPFSPTQPPSTIPTPSSSSTRISMPPVQNHAGQQEFRRRSTLDRPSSYARDRMSAYSVKSNASSKPSRTASSVFPFINSPLLHIHVRDFAYAQNHPFHYGPPPDPSAPPSGQSTPALDSSFNSPEYPNNFASLRTNWSETSAGGPGLQLAAVAYGDMPEDDPDHGPPYSEDEDLHSPVVISSHSRRAYDDDRGYFAGVNGDGSENYYLSDPSEEAGGPGGVVETYPSEQARHGTHSRHISHTLDHSNTYYAADASFDGQNLAVGAYDPNSRRLSRDYSFTIASPDEEMHGTAVALYDFSPENDNELPLVEGQVIWVSYRNGQGWLVAEDPKTRETGLVPEEYVRLFRHIEQEGWQRLTGDDAADAADLLEGMALSPVSEQPEMSGDNVFLRKSSMANSGQAIQSTFSTSSKDLEPFPHPLPTVGQAPPQIMHQRAESQSIAELLSPTSVTSMLSPKSLPPADNKNGPASHSRQSSEADRRRSTDSTKEREKEKESVSRRGSKNSRQTSKSSKR